MRMYAVYQKSEDLSFISHLDIQRTLHRAFRRADIPLAYSEGFNPHPLLSFAAATATGTASEAEWFEVKLFQDMQPDEFVTRVNRHMPVGLRLLKASVVPDNAGKLTTMVRAAEYRVRLQADEILSVGKVQKAINELMAGEIIVEKRTKGGLKMVDIRPQVISVGVEGVAEQKVILRILGMLQTDGGLRTELFTDTLFDHMGVTGGTAEVCRTAMYFESDGVLPRLPS